MLRPILLALLLCSATALPLGAQSTGGPAVTVDGVAVRPVQYDNIYTSALTTSSTALRDGSRGELWMFEGRAGECVAIAMDSPVFDARIILRQGEPFGTLVAQVEEGDDADASIRVVLPSTTTYYITATAAAGASPNLGAYELDLERC